jgi:signal transduction histidine kinase
MIGPFQEEVPPPAAERARSPRWIPLSAFAFVILSLAALAVAPAVQLARIGEMQREMAATLLPLYDRLRHLALTMERQSAAVRGYLLTGDAQYAEQLDSVRVSEVAALDDLEPLARRLGPGAEAELGALRSLSARRYAENAALMRARAGPVEYQATFPRLEQLRDSILIHVVALESELVRITGEGFAAEARGLQMQRALSFALGALAILAALLVGWFARRQIHLTRLAERSLAEATRRREELERVTESRERLMRGFSHDLKNPLGAADGYLHLLSEGVLGPLSDRQAHSVGRASRSIGGAIHLVEDLLELARAESGKLEIRMEPTDLRGVVADAAEEYRAQAEARGLKLGTRLPEVPFPVVTDGARVRQVLGNLIANAVKYTAAGAVTVRLDDARSGTPGGIGRIAIHVDDTGPGIPPEQLGRLFEEFVRLDTATERGTGIGLTISRRIAEALGGEITVHSEPGSGSTFTLWLPHGEASTPSAP